MRINGWPDAMLMYFASFTNGPSVDQHFREALRSVRGELESTTDEWLLSREEDALAEYFASRHLIEPIERDPSREMLSRPMEGSPSGPQKAIVEIPVLPKPTNGQVVRLHTNNWPGAGLDCDGGYQAKEAVLELHSGLSDLPLALKLIDDRLKLLADEIARYTPGFKEQVRSLVQQRLTVAKSKRGAYDAKMAELGIKVVRKEDATQPIDVRVRREVQILRAPPTKAPGPREPRLEPKSLELILDLIDKSGRQFEISPAAYRKLEEEELRSVVLGHLNAVFDRPAATGETFSKKGKTDIHLLVDSGAVLVGECHIWDGQARYAEKLNQLFGYLTFRHTEGVMVTFSRTKGLSRLVNLAKEATRQDPSFKGELIDVAETRFTSEHQHPADGDKALTIHHLMFDLWVG